MNLFQIGKWLALIIAIILISVGSVFAKQDYSLNQRVISQKEQISAGDQSNKPIDIMTTKKIRNKLVNDDALSVKAKNIKIITSNNGVTLKGNVETAAERAKILKHAYLSAPKHKIYNQITVVR